MFTRNDTRGRRRPRLLQLGAVAIALAFTLGAPAAPEVAPVPASQAQAQMPEPFPPMQFGFWDIRICLMTCFPEWALCCEREPDPLY